MTFCLCRYHLQYDLLAKGLTRLRAAIKCSDDCQTCKDCPPLATGLKLRAALTCPRPEGEEWYDQRACVKGECAKCKDLVLVGNIMCPARQKVAANFEVKWERYEKVHVGQDKYTGEDKHDFHEQTGSGSELFAEIQSVLKTFNPYHDLAKQQDDDWTSLKRNFPRRSFVTVQCRR